MRDAGGTMQWVSKGAFRVQGDDWGNYWYVQIINDTEAIVYTPQQLQSPSEWRVTAQWENDGWGGVGYLIEHWEYVPNMVPSALWEAFARYNQSNSNPYAIANYTNELAAPFRGEPFKLTEQDLIDATPGFYYNVARPQSNSGYTEGSNYRVIAAWCVKDALNAKGFQGDKWLALPEIQAYIATGAAEGMSRWQATQESDDDFGALIAIIAGAAILVATGGGGITALLGQATAAGEVAASAALTATEAASIVETWSVAEYATAVSTQAFAAEVAAAATADIVSAVNTLSDVAQNVSTVQNAVVTLHDAAANSVQVAANAGDPVLELTANQLTETASNLSSEIINTSNTLTETVGEVAQASSQVENAAQTLEQAISDITSQTAGDSVPSLSEALNQITDAPTSALPPTTTNPTSVISEIAKQLKISPSTALNVFTKLFSRTGGTGSTPTYVRRPNAPSDYQELVNQYTQNQENYGIGIDVSGLIKELALPIGVIVAAILLKGK